MSFAFLFLIYDNFNNPSVIKKFTKNQNIYIHPKYPDKVQPFFKPFIIPDLVDTKWGTMSIVNATINLLSEAFKNTDNQWFVLLSQDSFPLYDFNTFISKFNKIHNNRSIFFLKDKENNKTAQWFILKRPDVEIILNNKHPFKLKIKLGGFDEYYFLTILKWNIPNYKFTNSQIMYDKWLTGVPQKSPQYFNYFLQEDLKYIKENNCLFVRKITKYFKPIVYLSKRKLFVIYIGTLTKQDFKLNPNSDYILLISIPIDMINPDFIKHSIYIINIIYKFFHETVTSLCHEPFIRHWKEIIFIPEIFDLINQSYILVGKQIYDNSDNIAFLYTT
jgi:hypothetical protein